MPERSEKQQDKWADWLTRGRQRGLGETEVRQMTKQLHKLRDRVLKGAKLRAHQKVLDVGAGTGLLALEVQRRVKTGLVVACDISHDALASAELDAPVVGSVLELPFADASFDRVLTRSVLIYLDDKAAGISELHRVLRPGGRASIFEPINDLWRTNTERLLASGVYDDFRPAYDRIVDAYRTSAASTFVGWDERDLSRWFEETGFSEVRLTYEYISHRPSPPKHITPEARELLRKQWKMRPNPHDPSFEELVNTLLGDEANDYLSRFEDFALANPQQTSGGSAWLTARRAD